MKKSLKICIQTAFEPPSPKKKETFINTFKFPKLTIFDFVKKQFFYIRLRFWMALTLVVIFAVYLVKFVNINVESVWLIASVLPAISLIIVTEISRSEVNQMCELEMTCLYNYSHIVLSRLSITSLTSAFIIVLLQVFLLPASGYNLFSCIVYFNIPLMLSAFGCLFSLNRIKPSEVNLTCTVICSAVCIACLIIFEYKYLFEVKYLLFGFTLCLLTIFGIVKETKKFVQRTEKFVWN